MSKQVLDPRAVELDKKVTELRRRFIGEQSGIVQSFLQQFDAVGISTFAEKVEESYYEDGNKKSLADFLSDDIFAKAKQVAKAEVEVSSLTSDDISRLADTVVAFEQHVSMQVVTYMQFVKAMNQVQQGK